MTSSTPENQRHRPACAFLSALLVLILLPLTGCFLADEAACLTYSSQYQDKLAEEGRLSETVESLEPYPMAIVVSQDSLNRIFAAVSEGDLGEITWEYEVYGIPFTLVMDPELPLIQVGGENGCGDCLLLEMGFGLSVDIYGLPAYGGYGSARFQFPLAMHDNGIESTDVLARLGEAEVLNVDFSLSGISDYYLDAIEPYVELAATLVIQEYYGDTLLFTLDSWKIGNGDVRLLARGPHINPQTGTVVLGIHTNLIRPLSSTIEWNPTLPEGADLSMQFHPELVQRMIERMLSEGNIGRTYDASGQASESGIMEVTLLSMSASSSGLLEASFRLWLTSGGYCGYVDLTAALGLSITADKVDVQVAGIDITGGAGVGELVVIAEDWLTSQFTADMASFSELTINYRELNLPGGKQADMSAESVRLEIGANGLAVYLNLDAVVDATVDAAVDTAAP